MPGQEEIEDDEEDEMIDHNDVDLIDTGAVFND